MSKKEKAILITGASGGIGSSICKAFYDDGYFVIATDIEDNGVYSDKFLSLGLMKLKVAHYMMICKLAVLGS